MGDPPPPPPQKKKKSSTKKYFAVVSCLAVDFAGERKNLVARPAKPADIQAGLDF